jgi:hypothetical protein
MKHDSPFSHLSIAKRRAVRARKARTRAKLQALRQSWTVWFAAAVPVFAAMAATAQDLLPALRDHIGPWHYAAASVAVSGIVAWLRVRNVQPGGDK